MAKKLSDMSLQELWVLFPIRLTGHKDVWKDDYREMEARLRFGLSGMQIVRISHIGSTAIEGICAKDIIDILLEVSRTEDLEHVARVLEEMGFTRMSSSASRISLNWGYTEEGFADKVYHLHIRYEGDNYEM